MDLIKQHKTGTPLSAAEHEQRRKAARARWALTIGAGATGALAGAEIGRIHTARAAPRQMADALAATDAGVTARANQRQATINDAISRRLRGTPSPAAPDLPVVGTAKNKRIYDYQIAELRRRQLRNPADAKPLQTQIDRLTRLSGRAPVTTARTGTMRFRNRAEGEAHLKLLDAQIEDMSLHGLEGDAIRLELMRHEIEQQINTAHPVAAHVMQAFRGGETTKQINRRLADERTRVRARRQALLTTLERRTAQVRIAQRALTVNAMEQMLHARMARAGGKGAAIGALIGLTAAGIGLLAHHAAHTRGKKPKPAASLSKATEQTPENSIGQGVAESFRDWIDRLLGKTTTPVNLGDSIARAVVPGITQAFADGATQPPVTTGADDPAHKYTIDVDFDLLNPAVRRHMANYALDRIVQISQAQRDAIRTVLMEQSVLQGIGPRDVARSIRESIGLTPYQMNIVKGYRDELTNLDPAALERKLRDRRFDKTVKRAIETNTPLSADQIDAMVAAYHRRMLALRAETIARTESIRATSYGAVARAQDVLDTHPDLEVVKVWIATDDHRTRPTHRDLDKQEVTGMETPFRTSAGNLLRWPIDQEGSADEVINCRCSIGFRFIRKTDAAAPMMAEAV